MSSRKHYSLRTKAAVLAALDRNGGHITRTSLQTGVSRGTVSRWAREAQQRTADEKEAALKKEMPLDEQLEQLARQMVDVMPEKVEEATLQELARALPIVLKTLKETRTSMERSSNVREKFALLLNDLTAEAEAAGILEPAGSADEIAGGGE
ncbi:MAG: hypothetical protein ABI835_18220 [Chloroflexota bacterium]